MATTKFESRVIKCAYDTVLAHQDYKRSLDDNSGLPVQSRYLKKLNTALTALDLSLSTLSRDNDKKSQARARAASRRRDEAEESTSAKPDYTSTFKTLIDLVGNFNRGRHSSNIVEGEIVE